MSSYSLHIHCIPHLFVQLAARAGSKCVFTSFPTFSISPRLSPVFFPYMLAPNVYFQDVYVRTRNLVAWFTRFRCAFLTQHVKLQLFHLLYPPPVCAIGSACWVKMCIYKFPTFSIALACVLRFSFTCWLQMCISKMSMFGPAI